MIANVTRSLLKRNVIGMASRNKGLYPYYYPFLVVPPEKRIPFAEKVFWGIFITSGILSVPVWVLVHMEEYRGGWSREH